MGLWTAVARRVQGIKIVASRVDTHQIDFRGCLSTFAFASRRHVEENGAVGSDEGRDRW